MQASWGEIGIKYEGEEISFPFHIPSGEIFNNDPESLVRLKHFGLVLITPLITVIRSVYWLTKAIFLALSEIYHYLDEDDPSDESHIAITEAAHDSVRSWKYGGLMTGYAFAGIFAPHWARRHYGQLERTLNRHSDGPHRDKFYAAICFQPLCTLLNDDQLNDEDAAKKLNKYLTRVDAIQEAFWSCSWTALIRELSHTTRG